MSKNVTKIEPKDVKSTLEVNKKSLSKIDKALTLAQSFADLAPILQDTLNVAESIVKSYYSYKELELNLDFKLSDNQERRKMLLSAFQNMIEHLQNITNKFLDKIENTNDEKSKDRYANLLLDVLSKSDNLTLELMKRI